MLTNRQKAELMVKGLLKLVKPVRPPTQAEEEQLVVELEAKMREWDEQEQPY